MSFRALLVSKDDQAVEALTPVLSNFGLTVQRCLYPDAVCLVSEQRFHAVLVDFDDPHSATLTFENLSAARCHPHAVTVALLADPSKVRNAFGAGANFVVYKPVNGEQAEGTLRAAASLIRSERRSSFRVPVQVPVMLISNVDEASVPGILLDLSEDGMDVLASQPLYCSTMLHARFILPDLLSDLQIPGEVMWANPNGESGIRFAEVPAEMRAVLRTWLADHARQAPPQEPAPRPDCKLTDLSVGGCYVETVSPFPERTHLLLKLRASGNELETPGLVRVMHPSHGMGIEFIVQNADQSRKVDLFIRSLSSQADFLAAPRAWSSAQLHATSSSDVEDPLRDLLRNHESLTQEMFLEALQSQRSGQVLETQ
ncbi:MAG: PilZ domain-containing protein [Terriglobales bacterium]